MHEHAQVFLIDCNVHGILTFIHKYDTKFCLKTAESKNKKCINKNSEFINLENKLWLKWKVWIRSECLSLPPALLSIYSSSQPWHHFAFQSLEPFLWAEVGDRTPSGSGKRLGASDERRFLFCCTCQSVSEGRREHSVLLLRARVEVGVLGLEEAAGVHCKDY